MTRKEKEKEKEKRKRSKKSLQKEQARREKKSKKGKVKRPVKALWKEIKRLTRELQVKDDEISSLKNRQGIEQASTEVDSDLASSLTEWPDNAESISDRKKMWERHQYLRTRYEYHLAAGHDKNRARTRADKDLRERYGEDAGYTEEQLGAILS